MKLEEVMTEFADVWTRATVQPSAHTLLFDDVSYKWSYLFTAFLMVMVNDETH